VARSARKRMESRIFATSPKSRQPAIWDSNDEQDDYSQDRHGRAETVEPFSKKFELDMERNRSALTGGSCPKNTYGVEKSLKSRRTGINDNVTNVGRTCRRVMCVASCQRLHHRFAAPRGPLG